MHTTHKNISALVVLLFVFALITGCSTQAPVATVEPVDISTKEPATPAPTKEPTETPIIVTDTLGRTVEFNQLPQKIVFVGKATSLLTNSAFMFPEAEERVISYELRLQMKDRNFIKTAFPATENLVLLEKDAGAEQIAPLNPDLVIMKTYLQEKLGASIEALDINVVYLDLETPEKFYQDIRTLGTIFGNDARAEEIVSIYQQNETRIADALTGITDDQKPFVLMLQYSNKEDTIAFSIPPMDWLQSMLIVNAGGNPVWKDSITDGGWTIVNLEQIAAWNPDMIFIVDYSGKAVEAVDNLKSDSNWQALNAVINDKIYAFPVDFLSWDQADSRWSLGELWLATKMHPEQFASINMQDELVNFYKTNYGLDNAAITEKVLPLLSGDL